VRILVLGLGNDLYGDDGVGLHAVRRLEASWPGPDLRRPGPPPDVEFRESLLSGAALLDVVAGWDALVIIDTIIPERAVPGRTRILDEADIRDVPGPSPHYISVPQTMAIGRAAGLAMPRTVKIVAVEAEGPFRLGEGLSAEMSARLPGIVAEARRAVEDLAARPA